MMPIELKSVMCLHNVANIGYRGKTMRSVVFIKPGTLESYIWITSAGQEYKEGQLYDITADHEGRGILKRVRLINDYAADSAKIKEASEQPDHETKTPVDVFNLIYGIDTPLTNA